MRLWTIALVVPLAAALSFAGDDKDKPGDKGDGGKGPIWDRLRKGVEHLEKFAGK
jgi:hypothetical protein